jgi:hypothetical protein
MTNTFLPNELQLFRAQERARMNSIARRMIAHAIRRERAARHKYNIAVKLFGPEHEDTRVAMAALLETNENTLGMQVIFRGYDEARCRLVKGLRS